MNHDELKILLSSYIDGEVTPSEKDLVENHLVSCESCQKEFAEFKKVSSSLKRWPQERLSPDVELNIKARLAKTKERDMEKHEVSIQWSSIAIVIVVMMVSTLAFQQYAQRGLQARVRDANLYLSTPTIALGKNNQYEPYYLSANYAVERKQESGLQAKMKSATDDIGDQFSPGNTSYIRTQGSGTVDHVESEKAENKVRRRDYSQEGTGRLASAPAARLKDESHVSASVSADASRQQVQYFAKEKAADKLAMVQNNEPLAGYKKQDMGAVAGGFRVMEQTQVHSEELRADLNRNIVGGEADARIYSQPVSTVVPVRS
jgi:hypothetical protein